MHPPDNYNEDIVSNMWGTFIKRTFKVDWVKSPLDVLKDYEDEIKKILKRLLEEKRIKTYITMKIRMNQMKNGEVMEMDKGFNGRLIPIFSNGYLGYAYKEWGGKIMEDFEAFDKNESGWVFERVVDLQLYTGEYTNVGIYYDAGTSDGVNPREVDYRIGDLLNLESVAFARS